MITMIDSARKHRPVPALVIVLGLAVSAAEAQFAYPGCADLKPADFRVTELFTKAGGAGVGIADAGLAEPVQMDLHAVRKGDTLSHVDIYFVQRLGAVKHYDGAAKRIATLGTIANLGKVDNALMGLALHPDFSRNRWIYFWYSPNKLQGQNRLLRLSRITVTAENRLDLAGEKILMEILASKSDAYHSGGPMTFDAHGDLWVTVGNNSPDLDPATLNVLSVTDSTHSAEWGPSNTANLRGGIFRIHPDSSGKGYSVPKGNFGDYWAAKFESQGKAALAADYRNPAKVLPEVYVKGNRSNYSITVHPTKRWLGWGEVNYSGTNDEFNLVANPTFAGYPYFHADNAPTGAHGQNPATPRNTSPFNNGVQELPPAAPGTINSLVNVAIAGPLYVFDRSLASAVKFPPHLHLSWSTFSWVSSQMHIHTLDTVQLKVTRSQRVDNGLLAALKLRKPLQARYGPEGALYVLNYDGSYNTINPGVSRVDHIGACRLPVSAREARAPELDYSLSPTTFVIREAGVHGFTLYDLAGKARGSLEGNGAASYSLAELKRGWKLEKGVYIIRVGTAKGAVLGRLSLF